MTNLRRAAAFLPALVGVAVALWVSWRAVYVSHDGLAYIGAARNLIAGTGFETPPGSPPIENFAPLFPLVLAWVGELGPDPLSVAKVLNPLLLGATTLLVTVAVLRLTGSLLRAAVAGALVAAGTDALIYHSSALSEPLFIFLSACAICSIVAAIRRGGWWVGAAVALTAAAVLTRYAGIALVAGGAAALVIVPRPRRWIEAALFVLGTVAPAALWLVASDGLGHRQAVWHWPGLDYLTNIRLASLVLIALAVVVVVAGRRLAIDVALVLGLVSAAYLAVLIGDRLLFDVTGRLDGRFLLPLYVAAVAALAAFVRRHRVAMGALIAIVVVQGVLGAVWVQRALVDDDRGFASEAWERAPVFEALRRAPPHEPIYSNGVDVIAFHTGRTSLAIPEKRILLTGDANASFQAEVGEMMEAGGLLIWFEAPARRVFLPTPDELGLTPVGRDRVSATYRLSAR